jgi:hypothetical protein
MTRMRFANYPEGWRAWREPNPRPTARPARGKRDCEGETTLDKGVVARKDGKAFRTNRVEVAADYLVATFASWRP